MSLHQVKISPHGVFQKIEVDDVDISAHVSRCVVDMTNGQVPRVILEGNGQATLEEQTGIVIERVDERVGMVEFLSNIDPSQLETDAMNMLGLDGEGTLTVPEAMLKTLMRYASGD